MFILSKGGRGRKSVNFIADALKCLCFCSPYRVLLLDGDHNPFGLNAKAITKQKIAKASIKSQHLMTLISNNAYPVTLCHRFKIGLF